MSFATSLTGQWAATVYSAAVSMLLAILLGRILGPAGYGHYSFVMSAACIYAIIQDGGFRTLIFREKTSASGSISISKNSLASVSLGHVTATTIPALLIVLALPIPDRIALAIALFGSGLNTVVIFISSYLKGAGKFHTDALWQSAVRTATAVSILGAIWISDARRIEMIFLGWAGGLMVVFLLPVARRFVRRPDFSFKLDTYRIILFFLTIDVATALYFRSDIVLLKILLSDQDGVGHYAAAYRLLSGVIFLMTPVAHLCFRSLRLVADSPRAFKAKLMKMIFFMLALALLGVLIGFFMGEWVVVFAFGTEYAFAGYLFAWLAWSLVFILPNYILTQGAIAINLEKFYAGAAVICAAVNIAMNILLIPHYGTLGAVWSTVATEGVLAVVLTVGISKNLRCAQIAKSA